jgi:pilus assembly protein CpaC
VGGNGFIGLGPKGVIDPIRVRLDALYTSGAARLLSNPNTTVNTGRLATFQVGGQIPYPAGSTTNGAGTSTTIEFKDFGIIINVMPTANPDGVVTLAIFTEVSQPDFATGVVPPGGGSAIPGFSRRSSTTEVTVPPSGTVALSGLIQNDITRTVSKIPVLSKIPILGSLFQSKRFQKNESELVIFVRPRVLPNPLIDGQTAPSTVSAAQKNEGALGAGAPQTNPASSGAFNLNEPEGLNTPTTSNVIRGAGTGGGNAQ